MFFFNNWTFKYLNYSTLILIKFNVCLVWLLIIFVIELSVLWICSCSTKKSSLYLFSVTSKLCYISGQLIEPEYAPTGCNESDYGPVPMQSWVAFVQRGECFFSTKSQVALSLGAQALLVYQATEKNTITVMSNIPGVLDVYAIGFTLAPLI